VIAGKICVGTDPPDEIELNHRYAAAESARFGVLVFRK